MIISRTPLRVSFLGGGTDYPLWYRENSGAVLATTIDKYCHITCRYLPPFFEHKSRVVYSKIEYVGSNDDIRHPAVRAALKHFGINDGVEVHYDADLPARTGLGSSSSFTVGMLHALFALVRTMPTKKQLADAAIHIEQQALREVVGCQDQVMAAFGGLNRIDFLANDQFRVTPVILGNQRMDELEDRLMLFFTGFSRTASEIAKEQIEQMDNKRNELLRIREMVDEGMSILTGRDDLDRFGQLLHEAWSLKRTLSSLVATPAIDQIYDEARNGGAIGGKLLGAGGGGFMLIFARKEDQPRITERLERLLLVPFRFEHSGSQIIHYDPYDSNTRGGVDHRDES